jgi:hypothetical protein
VKIQGRGRSWIHYWLNPSSTLSCNSIYDVNNTNSTLSTTSVMAQEYGLDSSCQSGEEEEESIRVQVTESMSHISVGSLERPVRDRAVLISSSLAERPGSLPGTLQHAHHGHQPIYQRTTAHHDMGFSSMQVELHTL